jgi:hypothetical protein
MTSEGAVAAARLLRSAARLLCVALLALLFAGGAEAVSTKGQKSSGSATGKEYLVEQHKLMPSPRPAATESHHGLMSAWMKAHYAGYSSEEAPAVLMPKSQHDSTRSVYNKWRAKTSKAHGGAFDWQKVTEAEVRALGNEMFEQSGVPKSVRQQYWAAFDAYRATLTPAAKPTDKKGSRR